MELRDDSRGRRSIAPWLVLGLLAAAGLVRGVELWRFFEAQNRLPQWDMAQNALLGSRLARDLADGRIPSFLLHLHKHETWPFGFSLILVPFLLFGGGGLPAATLAVIVTFSLIPLALGWVCRELDRGPVGMWLALVSSGLFLASPMLHLLSVVVLRETAGILGALVAMALYLRATRLRTLSSWRLAGLGALALFFVKYNYGGVWLVAVVVHEVWLHERERSRYRASKGWLLLAILLAAALLFAGRSMGNLLYGALVLATVLLLVASLRRDWRGSLRSADPRVRAAVETIVLPIWLWCLVPRPNHIRGVIRFLANRESGLTVGKGALFYPRVFLEQYAPTTPIGLVIAACAAWGLILAWRRGAGFRLLALFAVLQLGGMCLHPYKEPRFLATLMPAVFLLAALPLVVGLARLAGARHSFGEIPGEGIGHVVRREWVVTGLLSLGLILEVGSETGRGLWRRWVELTYPTYSSDPRMSEALRALHDLAERDAPVGILGTFNELSPALVEWELGRGDVGPRFQLVPGPRSVPGDSSNEEMARRVDAWIAKRRPRQVLAIVPLGDSAWVLSKDYREHNACQERMRLALDGKPGWSRDAERALPGLGMTVVSYRSGEIAH